MMNKRAWLLAGTVATALALCGCASSPATPRTVAEAIAAHPQLSTLNKLIHDNGLAATLNETGPFTVFAPTDDAFKAAPARTSESLKDKERVVALVKFHVVPGTMTSDEVRNGNAPTLNGATVALSKSGAFVTVEDAVVTTPDLPAGNGVVHLVDRVLTPPQAK